MSSNLMPIEVAHYSNIVDDGKQFHVQALKPDGTGWVCGENKVWCIMC